jgi:4-amino-4-deoxy-L-arabinose transferase-like glycosyltransferase
MKFQLHYLILFIILLLGTLIRIYHPIIFSAEDATYFTEAVKIAKGIYPSIYTETWAPAFFSGRYGYFISDLRAIIYLFSTSIEIQIYFTIVLGVLSIYLTYLIGKEYNKKTGLLSALLISIFPMHVIFSRGLYLEVPLLFFTLTSIFLLIRGIKQKNIRILIISSIFLSFALLTKIYALLFVLSTLIWIIIYRRSIGKKLFFKTIIIFLIPLLIWLTWAIPNIKKIYNETPFSVFGISFIKTFASQNTSLTELFQIFSYSTILILPGICFAIYKRKPLDTLLISFISIFIFFFQFISTSANYYYLSIAPLLFILASRIILEISNSLFSFFIKILLIIFLIIFVYLSLESNYLALRFNQGGYYGFFIPNTLCFTDKWTFCPYPLVVGWQNEFLTIKKLKDISSENDIIFLSEELRSYEGMFLDKNFTVKILPSYQYFCNLTNTEICYTKNWENEVKDLIQNFTYNNTDIWILSQDRYYPIKVLGNVSISYALNQSVVLEQYFTKIYKICSPDEETLEDYCMNYLGFNDKKCYNNYECLYLFKV